MALSAFTLLLSAQNSASGTGPAAGTGYTPASFTTVTGSLLVVALAPNENASNTNVPSTITLTNNAGLSFTLQKAQSASTAFDSGAMIWTAQIASGAAGTTVTFTSTVNMGTYGVVIGHYASGFDTTTPVLGTGGTSKSTGFSPPETGAFTLSNAPLAGDEIFAVASNNQALTTTPGSGWTEVADVANTVWANIEVQTIRGVTSTSVAWTSLYATGSAFSYAVAGIVIKAASGAAVAIPTNNPVRRRTQAPRRRPKATAVVPAQVIVPPFIPVQVKEARVLRGRLPRRGRAVTPVPAQVIVPPTIPTKGIQPRRLRGLLPRRGRVVQVVPSQVTVAPPSYPPLPVRVRLRGALVRRNRNVQVVPAQVTQINPPYPPVNLRVRVRGALSRRGHTVTPVPAQATPPLATWTPAPVRVRLRAALARRGRVVTPPAPDAWVPWFTRLRERLMPPKRGRTRTPVPAQVVVAPPAYPPQPVHRTRRGLRRRTHNVEGWMVGAAQQVCDTPRPFTGTTAYGLATTPRPGSGTTAYGLATTARPNTGETDPPCG